MNIAAIFLGLLYSINRNNISSAPVDNQDQISTETNQTQASVVASIQSQSLNTVSVQASFFQHPSQIKKLTQG